MTPSLTMNWEQPWRPHFAVYELAGQLRELPCDLRGLIRDFRDYAWVHFGLPTAMEELEGIALSFRFSRYKFRKYWGSVMKKFFIESDSRLYFADDEHHRSQARENLDKAREYGRLGVVAKRNKQSGLQFSSQGLSTAPLTPPLNHTETETDRYSNTAAVENTTTPVAATADSNTCPTTYRLIASIFADVTPTFIARLLSEAQKIYPAVSDDDLALAIRATYKGNKQTSAGLFLEMVPAWLRNQQPKKPQIVESPPNGVLPGREKQLQEFLKAREEGRGGEYLEQLERAERADKVSGL